MEKLIAFLHRLVLLRKGWVAEQLQCASLPSAARSMEDLPAADAPIKVYENTYITKPNDNQR